MRYEHNAPRNVCLTRKAHGCLDCRKQLGPSASTLLFNQTNRVRDALPVRRKRLFRKHCGVSGEQNDVEQIRWPEVSDQIAQKRFGSIQRKAVHRAGNIYHKNVFSDGYVRARYPHWRLSHVKKEVFIFTLIEDEARSDFVSRQTIAQDKVTIPLIWVRIVRHKLSDTRALPLRKNLVRSAA